MSRFAKFMLIILSPMILFGCESKHNPASSSYQDKLARGDIDANGVSAQPEDVELLSRYFTEGNSVFTIDRGNQIAATDVNRDGKTLTPADLVFLTHLEKHKSIPLPDPEPVHVTRIDGFNPYSIDDSIHMGAAYVVVSGNHSPFFAARNMRVEYRFDGTNTHVLIWSPEGNTFSGEYLSIGGYWESVEYATPEGRTVILEEPDIYEKIKIYFVYQNPRSSIISIYFYSPVNISGTFIITNSIGKKVYETTASFSNGLGRIDWDLSQYGESYLRETSYTGTLIIDGHTYTVEIDIDNNEDMDENDSQRRTRSESGVFGDINLNGIAFEIADAVLYSNYFVYGQSVFTVRKSKQIIATDANKDGNPLTIADLVYLVRRVVGDALIPKVDTVNVQYSHNSSGQLSVRNNQKIGAAFVVVEGNQTPQLIADDMEMLYAYDGRNTRILVWSQTANSFTRDFLNIYGQVISIEMATDEGQPVKLIEFTPEPFYVSFNNSMPFNSNITIYLALSKASTIDLQIVNSRRIPVFTFSDSLFAGAYSIVWNLAEQSRVRVPNGTYFLTVTDGSFEKSFELQDER